MRMKSVDPYSTRRFTPEPEIKLRSRSEFVSVTEHLLEMSRNNMLVCPGCGKPLDLKNGVEWQGPMDVACSSCSTLIHIRTLVRAMKETNFR